jgi:DNA repair protein RecO (recombination protein O)
LSSEKSIAIVLRVVEFSETSCVVTLFSREFGKISALAKGARRPKSPFEAALDLLAVCRIVFLHKATDALDLLTEAKLERRFRAAGRDLSRLYAGYYIAELLRELTDEGDPHPQLYDAADRALAALDGEVDAAAVVLCFELGALRVLGHLPALADCAACGGELEHGDRVPFGMLAGGALCARCRAGQRQVVSISRRALEVLRVLAEDENPDWAALTIPRENRGEARGVMNQYICTLLGKRPRLHAYLGGA